MRNHHHLPHSKLHVKRCNEKRCKKDRFFLKNSYDFVSRINALILESKNDTKEFEDLRILFKDVIIRVNFGVE